MQIPMLRGDAAFARACQQLERCARINFEGLSVCLELHAEDPDANSERMVAESMSYALAQAAYLLRPMQLLAIDMELAAAAKVES